MRRYVRNLSARALLLSAAAGNKDETVPNRKLKDGDTPGTRH